MRRNFLLTNREVFRISSIQDRANPVNVLINNEIVPI
jgi:hypothetical protein